MRFACEHKRPRRRRASSREVVALSLYYCIIQRSRLGFRFDCVRRVSGRAVFDRGTAGRSSVKQTLIGIFLWQTPRRARGVVRDLGELKYLRRKQEREREGVIVSLRYLDRGLATTHTHVLRT